MKNKDTLQHTISSYLLFATKSAIFVAVHMAQKPYVRKLLQAGEKVLGCAGLLGRQNYSGAAYKNN